MREADRSNRVFMPLQPIKDGRFVENGIVAKLLEVAPIDLNDIQLWLYHYCATGSQRDKAEAAGVSLATYKTRFKSIEAVLVGYLIAGGRAA